MSFGLEGRVIFFATNNINKFNEARKVLASYQISVGMLRVKSLEIQHDCLEKIAKASVLEAFGKCRLPIIVEDAGLFISALKGFPGPYAAYAYKTIGNEGLLRLMKNVSCRQARFESVVAYCSKRRKPPKCFKGEIAGRIAEEPKKGSGNSGFGFDPVFEPIGSGRAFAEMTLEEKNSVSHRAMAFRMFGEWYRKLER